MVRRLFAGEGWIRTIGSAILNMLRKTGLSETDQCTTERSWTGSGVSRAFVKAQSRSAAEEPMVCGLFAGGNGIRTTGPAPAKGSSEALPIGDGGTKGGATYRFGP